MIEDALNPGTGVSLDALAQQVAARANGVGVCFVLDYDGTLVPIARRPEEAVLDADRRERLIRIAQAPGAQTIIVSGRDRFFLERQFPEFPATLVAEHGAFLKAEGSATWERRVEPLSEALGQKIRQIFFRACKDVPGSFIEEKEIGIVWHYRTGEVTTEQIQKIGLEIGAALAGTDDVVLQGHKLLEVKPARASKGECLAALLEDEKRVRQPARLVVIGDDGTDEEMYRVARERGGITIRVGPGETGAEYRLSDPAGVLALLEKIHDGLSRD